MNNYLFLLSCPASSNLFLFLASSEHACTSFLSRTLFLICIHAPLHGHASCHNDQVSGCETVKKKRWDHVCWLMTNSPYACCHRDVMRACPRKPSNGCSSHSSEGSECMLASLMLSLSFSALVRRPTSGFEKSVDIVG